MMTAQPADTTRTAPKHQAAEPPKVSTWRVLDETADVRFLTSGLPLTLRYRGGLWQVIGDPLSWSSSSSWWESGTPSPRGQGSVVTTRFWRFQAQTGPASPVLEFEMTADPRWEDWRLRRVAHVDGL
jgi:hypothetical protein